MNWMLYSLEIVMVLTGLGILLLDLGTPARGKRDLGYLGAFLLGLLLLQSVFLPEAQEGFSLMSSGNSVTAGPGYALDPFARYFKHLFILAAILVLLMTVDFADRLRHGVSEFFALVLFALAGMSAAASATNFITLFVSIELITVTFYVLTSFQRDQFRSLEAGVKYLILGAAASAVLVYGIALIYGATGSMDFAALGNPSTGTATQDHILQLGLLLVFAGLGFKIAAFPFQIWVPDVYQGAPAPVTAFLAVGSKAAGFALLMRLCHHLRPDLQALAGTVLAVLAGLTILYGSLCALRQRNLKRLLGYAGIASAGYLLLGLLALNTRQGGPTASADGCHAMLFYLAGYLFAVMAAFTVICHVSRDGEDEDLSILTGLHQRSPLLATVLTLSIISMAGIPPLVGFLGKFLLLQSALGALAERGAHLWLIIAALAGVVISLYYYFGILRAIYWGNGIRTDEVVQTRPPIILPPTARLTLIACALILVLLGIFPEPLLDLSSRAVELFR